MRKLTREEMYEYRDKYDFAPLYISSMDTSLSGRDAAKRQDSIHVGLAFVGDNSGICDTDGTG